jgi:tRNA (uracil-5-)-methyltransferase
MRPTNAVKCAPRAGLPKRALYALLAAPHVTRLVYVSCNPDSLAADARELLLPPAAVRRPHVTADAGAGAGGGKAQPPAAYEPFRPVMCQPVDMFPHTTHVEACMVFERGA